jgi:hypothetical protein
MLVHLHPFFSTFPVSLVSIIVTLEFLSLLSIIERPVQSIKILSLFLIAAVIMAFLSGYIANNYADGTFKIDDAVIYRHHAMGRIFLIITFPVVTLQFLMLKGEKKNHPADSSITIQQNIRIDKVKGEREGVKSQFFFLTESYTYVVYLLGLLVLLVFSLATSYRGGELIFKYGAGVRVEGRKYINTLQ